MRRARYQGGSVTLDPRSNVWYFRWTDRETGVRRAKRLGSITELPTKSAARKAADGVRMAANEGTLPKTVTFRAIVQRYMDEEMPERYSTRRGYLSYINNHILPRWADSSVSDVTPALMLKWLTEIELSHRSKMHLRGLMHLLFDYAMLWGAIPLDRNPVSVIKYTRKGDAPERKKVLTQEEFHKLLANMTEEPFHTMLLTCMCLGIRCSELVAMKWSDFDWENNVVLIQRSVVSGLVDKVKTRYSYEKLPMDDRLVAILLEWRGRSRFNKDADWVWASPHSGGEMPYQGWGIQHNKIRPAAKTAGLGPIGWHNLRHTYRAWLDSHGTPIGVQKDLMRHASITTTMNTYGAAMPESMRTANSKVARMALPN